MRTPYLRRAKRGIACAVAVACLGTASELLAATIIVTTTVDDTLTNGNCTLREAIAAAQANTAQDACPAGSPSEPDVILLGPNDYSFAMGHTIVAGGAFVVRGPATTPPSARVLLATGSRFIRMLSSADVTLENLQLLNGDVRTNPSLIAGGALAAQDTTDVRLVLRNVRMAFNRAVIGGALSFESGGNSLLLIEDSVFEANLAQLSTSGSASGGAAAVTLRGQACGQILNTIFFFNRVESTFTGGGARGGALLAAVNDEASLLLARVTIGYNEADTTPDVNPTAAGLVVSASGGLAAVEDVRLEGNNLQGEFVASGTYVPSALDVFNGFSGTVVLDRIQIIRNDPGEPARDVRIQSGSTGATVARNILVANGPARGAIVTNYGTGGITLAHWTLTGHAEEGLRLERSSAAELRLDNSILWSNGTDLATTGFPPPTVDPSNLIGANPLFVAPIADDYSLAAGSPAVDSGDKTLASMSRLDAAHAPRLDGADTDAGAYERGAIFGDGFEAGVVGTCLPPPPPTP